MRIAMWLLGALLLSGVAPAEAWAQRQEARPAAAGKAQASPARNTTTRPAAARPVATTRPAAAPPRRAAANRPTATRSAAPRSNQAASCVRRDRNGRCIQQAGPRSVAWQGGLPAASGEQAATCPTGTIATLARGHSDVVRCLPI